MEVSNVFLGDVDDSLCLVGLMRCLFLLVTGLTGFLFRSLDEVLTFFANRQVPDKYLPSELPESLAHSPVPQVRLIAV